VEKIKDLIGRINREKVYIIVLMLIIALGTFFRITYLNKHTLSDDETYCYYIAKQAFPFGILKTLFAEDIHAPLYFFILHLWMKLFGESDIVLRLLTVVFGVLNIPVGYLIGEKLLSKKAGLLTAAFISFNSLLIYYSQEVKFYSLLPLLLSISLLFLIKIVTDKEKKLYNYIGLVLSNLAFLYTYTFGFIFVFFETLFLALYLYLKKKELKSFIYAQLITFVLFLPYLMIVISHQALNYSKTFFDTISWWSSFDIQHILILIPNMFSPALVAMIGDIPDYFQIFTSHLSNPLYYIFVLLPITIYFTGMIKGISAKNNFVIVVFLSGLGFIGVEIGLILAGKFGIYARYTIIPLICFIVTACYGLSVIKNKYIKNLLIVSFLVINLFYLFFSQNSPQRMPKIGKARSVANLLDKYNVTAGDIVLLPPYGHSVNKYLLHTKIYNSIYFDVLRPNCIEMLFGKKLLTKLNKDNSYDYFINYVASPQPSFTFDSYVKANIVDKLNKSHCFIIVKDKDIAIFDKPHLNYLLYVNPTAFSPIKSKSMYFMLYSKTLDDYLIISNKYLKLKSIEKSGLFEIYVFNKLK